MSKLSQLKQKAYKAGKDRNWDLAISVYKQILEVEKSNPTIINELGDLCLKSGDTRAALKHFLSASNKYRKTGLLNNSVAICKKILRHDDDNSHAHWYLAEIRSSQNLVVEGEVHALAFLNGSDKTGAELQEIFLKRCSKLLELYPASKPILEILAQTFRACEKPLEASRADCLKACVVFDSGDQDGARAMVDDIMVTSPELTNYPEFGQWNKRVNPQAVEVAPPTADYNAVSLDGSDVTAVVPPESPEESPVEIPAEIPVETPVETPVESAPQATPVSQESEKESPPKISIDIPPDVLVDAAEPPVVVDDKDDEGCLVIDDGDGPDLEALVAQATQEVAADEETDTEPAVQPDTQPEPAESVDLLAQILSEDSSELLGDDSNQLDTIAAEIGSVVGGEGIEDEADRLYEMGMVYLEMGLFDKACESFETAAADDDFSIRAHEMWGITLQRAGRPDESITVLTSGLQYSEEESRENLSLRYHIGRAHEMADRPETAAEIYDQIQKASPNYLDTSVRLAQLTGV